MPNAMASEAGYQTRSVPSPAAPRLNLAVELIHQRRHRQRRAVAARLIEADREILAHPVDGEAEVEFAGDHRLVAIVHLPRLRRPFRDDVDHELLVEPGLLRETKPFGQGLHESRDADLVDHLRQLAGADGA